MRKKIFTTYIVTSVIILLMATILFSTIIGSYYVAELKKQLQNECIGWKYLYELGGVDSLAEVTAQSDNRITLIASDGTVLYDDHYDAKLMENHNGRYEVIYAKKNGSAEASRISKTIAKDSYYYAMLMDDGNVLRISRGMANMLGVIGIAMPWLVLCILLLLLAVALISSSSTKRIIEPINQLDLKEPMNNMTYEELTPLLKRMDKQNKQIVEQIKIIEQKQKEFNDVATKMNEGLLIIDKDGDIGAMNSKAVEIFGAHINDTYLSIFRDSKTCSAVEKAMTGEEVTKEFAQGDKQYELRISPVPIDGKYSLVAVIIDVTERLKTERMRREFSSNVSHELKTPLTSIMGYSELIANGLAQEENIKTFGRKILKESKRLFALVSDVLSVSKMEEENSTMKLEQVDLKILAEEVVENLTEKAYKQNVTLHLQCENLPIVCDRLTAYQMIFNLVDNAINYNVDGGKVTVTTVNNGETKCLSVQDTGIGIAQEDISHVTERFYRVDKSRSKDTGGTGLGLAIVKHTALAMKGSLDIQSKLNEGTTITIKF